MTVNEALSLTGNPVSDKAIYARIKRQKVKDEAVEYVVTEALSTLRVGSMSGLPLPLMCKSPSPSSLALNKTPVTPGTVRRKENKCPSSKQKSLPEGTINITIASKAATMKFFPGWIDRRSTANVMIKRRKQTANEVNRVNFHSKVTHAFCG